MKPYRFTINEGEIEELRRRLAHTRWPEQLPGVELWSKGVPVEQARGWAKELTDFDWQALQDELDGVPQFVTEIDGESIHFVHVPSTRDDAIPLLVLHGWPGTVIELIDLIEPLTSPPSPANPAFHVVIPSHPGTGLSGPTTQPGWGVDRTARAYAALMAELGYNDYVVQGGDHGAVLAPHLGRVDPDHVRGIHVNAATIGFIPMGPVDEQTLAQLSPVEQRRVATIGAFLTDGNGYNVIQATRPQTIGYGLEDSPVALLTWIIDKVHAWTHAPATLAGPRYRQRHLANVVLFWLTRTATSTANNVYAEYASLFANPNAFTNSGVPTAVIAFAEDPSIRRYAGTPNTPTPSSGGPTSTMAATSPPSNNPTDSSPIYGRSSPNCPTPAQLAPPSTPTLLGQFSDDCRVRRRRTRRVHSVVHRTEPAVSRSDRSRRSAHGDCRANQESPIRTATRSRP